MGRVHYAWVVAGVAFATLVAAAGFRAAPGVLMVPLHEAGWSISTMSAAVSVNLVLYGLIAPFAAALMDRFGIRRVVCVGLLLIAAGAGLSVLATTAWHLILTWGLLIGAGTGSMAMVFAATVANAWFVKRRGLVMGVLTAGGAAGQLVFLPLVAYLVEVTDWKVASLIVAAAALAVLPLAVALLRDRPGDVGLPPYGGEAVIPAAPRRGNAAAAALAALLTAAHTRAFWALAGAFASCGATTNGLIGIHFVPSAHDHGMATTTAAGLLMVVGGSPTGSIRAFCCWRSTRSAASGCCCCPGCSATKCTPAWCCSSSSTGSTGWPPCRPRWRCAAACSAIRAPSCSVGCSPRTNSARPRQHSARGSCAKRSAATPTRGSGAPRCAQSRRCCPSGWRALAPTATTRRCRNPR